MFLTPTDIKEKFAMVLK